MTKVVSVKINLIIPSFYPATVYGGPIFSTLHTCEQLSKKEDIELNISTTNANMNTKLDVEINKLIKFENNFYVKYYDETKIDKFSLQLYLNIWKDIKSADVVHIQSIFNTPTPISLLYAKVFNKPTLLSPRGSLGTWCIGNGSKFKIFWLNFFIKPFANRITWHATAEQEKQEILMIFPRAKVVIVPNGISYEQFQLFNTLRPKEYTKKFANVEIDAEKIIISMGRLQKKKGFDILINSFKLVLKEYPKSVLCIAGPDEGEQANLEKLIDKLKLTNQVFLVGSIENIDKVDFLVNADLFVLPSHNENFGNVYLESLAAGTPIIASKNTPWKDVDEYQCGKCVSNNKNDTSIAMLSILKMNKKKLSINSKKLAQNYSWKSIAEKFSIVFKDMIAINELKNSDIYKEVT